MAKPTSNITVLTELLAHKGICTLNYGRNYLNGTRNLTAIPLLSLLYHSNSISISLDDPIEVLKKSYQTKEFIKSLEVQSVINHLLITNHSFVITVISNYTLSIDIYKGGKVGMLVISLDNTIKEFINSEMYKVRQSIKYR